MRMAYVSPHPPTQTLIQKQVYMKGHMHLAGMHTRAHIHTKAQAHGHTHIYKHTHRRAQRQGLERWYSR